MAAQLAVQLCSGTFREKSAHKNPCRVRLHGKSVKGSERTLSGADYGERLARGETTTLNRTSRLCTQLCLQLMNLLTKTVEIKGSLPWMNYRF